MTGRLIHYSEPVEFHKSLPGSKSIVIMKRDDGVPDGYEPPKRKKVPQVRNARNEPIDDEVGKPPAEKGNNMTYDYDTSRGPYHAILDKMARARQAITGETYAKAFTETYCDPANAAIRDASSSYDLAKSYNATFGPVQKAAPPDPPQDDIVYGEANQELHELVVTRMKKNPALSYEQSFTHEYLAPENRGLKQRVDSEGVMNMRSLAPVRGFPAYGNPGDVAGGGRIGHTVGRSGAKPRNYAGG
jgi:hypothetical protein